LTGEVSLRERKLGGIAVSDKEIEAGKRWVEETLKRIAAEEYVTIEDLEWGRDFDKSLEKIAVKVGGKRAVERFSWEELGDCQGCKSTQARLEARLRELIKSLTHSGKKIGF